LAVVEGAGVTGAAGVALVAEVELEVSDLVVLESVL